MEMNEFIKHFGDQFDDTDVSDFTPDTRFRELEEWSSLNTLRGANERPAYVSIVYADISCWRNSWNEIRITQRQDARCPVSKSSS